MSNTAKTIGELKQSEPTFDFDTRKYLYDSNGRVKKETDPLATRALRSTVYLLMEQDATVNDATLLTNDVLEKLIALVPTAVERIAQRSRHELMTRMVFPAPIYQALHDAGGAVGVAEKYLHGLKTTDDAATTNEKE